MSESRPSPAPVAGTPPGQTHTPQPSNGTPGPPLVPASSVAPPPQPAQQTMHQQQQHQPSVPPPSSIPPHMQQHMGYPPVGYPPSQPMSAHQYHQYAMRMASQQGGHAPPQPQTQPGAGTSPMRPQGGAPGSAQSSQPGATGSPMIVARYGMPPGQGAIPPRFQQPPHGMMSQQGVAPQPGQAPRMPYAVMGQPGSGHLGPSRPLTPNQGRPSTPQGPNAPPQGQPQQTSTPHSQQPPQQQITPQQQQTPVSASNQTPSGGGTKRRNTKNADGSRQSAQHVASSGGQNAAANGPPKKRKLADKLLTRNVYEVVPESQAYIDLLNMERKVDETIIRKRLEIQESLKRPLNFKKKLRIFISSQFFPAKPDSSQAEERTDNWELRVEGKLHEDAQAPRSGTDKSGSTSKRKFSSFFKSLVIELDRDLYGPDNNLVEWHRTGSTNETDGFQVRRAGNRDVKCTLMFMLDYNPPQYKLDVRLSRCLGLHTAPRQTIISALWTYIKTHKLQDPIDRQVIRCDKYLSQVFGKDHLKFPEIPLLLPPLLHPAEHIMIDHTIQIESILAAGTGDGAAPASHRRNAIYDIEVEVDDPLNAANLGFIQSMSKETELASLDNKIYETVEAIHRLKTSRQFYLDFSEDPQAFINDWLMSQSRDLATMQDSVGDPEQERTAIENFWQPWSREAVTRYFYHRVQEKRTELEKCLNTV